MVALLTGVQEVPDLNPVWTWAALTKGFVAQDRITNDVLVPFVHNLTNCLFTYHGHSVVHNRGR
jgi:hypothetical protein